MVDEKGTNKQNLSLLLDFPRNSNISSSSPSSPSSSSSSSSSSCFHYQHLSWHQHKKTTSPTKHWQPAIHSPSDKKVKFSKGVSAGIAKSVWPKAAWSTKDLSRDVSFLRSEPVCAKFAWVFCTQTVFNALHWECTCSRNIYIDSTYIIIYIYTYISKNKE